MKITHVIFNKYFNHSNTHKDKVRHKYYNYVGHFSKCAETII